MNTKDVISKDKIQRDTAKAIVMNIINKYRLKGPIGYGVIFDGMTVAKWKPWNSDKTYNTALSKDRVHMIKQIMNNSPEGICYECGVFTGGITRMMLDQGRKVKAFDTFEGLKGAGEHDLMQDGEYNGGDVSEYIKGAEIIKGEIQHTLCNHGDDKIAFAHLDMDLYIPTKYALEFIYPRLLKGGSIVLDDYGVWMTPGIMKAVEEFNFGKKLYLPTGQMVITK